MTETEWDECHPDQCAALLDHWQQKQAKWDTRTALIQHTTALAGGLKRKGGAPLTLNDFLPAYVSRRTPKKDPAAAEALLKSTLTALAKRSKPNG